MRDLWRTAASTTHSWSSTATACLALRCSLPWATPRWPGTLTAQALSQGVERMEQLRHPERAAAWLRANVTHGAKGPAWGHQRPSEIERRDALGPLGVDPAVYDALASLDVRARAAVTATAVEGFNDRRRPRDRGQ